MRAKTLHVFPVDRTWHVKREGEPGKVFVTRREAVDVARKTAKKNKVGKFVVYGKDGRIRAHESYGMRPIQEPVKKSSRAIEISRAVGKVALMRVQSDTPRERPSKS